MINTNRLFRKNQHTLLNTTHISLEITNSPELFVCSLTFAERRAFEYIVFLANRYQIVAPTQSAIGHYAGITREHANRIIKKFTSLGILSTIYRHMTSCYYFLSPFFNNPFTRSRLSHLIKAFRFLPLSLLFQNKLPVHHITQYIIKNKGIYKDKRSNQVEREKCGPLYSGNENVLRKGIIGGSVANRDCNITQKACYGQRNKSKNKWGMYPERGIMEQIAQQVYGDNPISPIIRSLTELNLTKWGQIRLSAFPDEAILYAQDKLKNNHDIINKYNWFFKVCYQYCTDTNIKPDWQLVEQLSIGYKMPVDAPMTLPTPTATIPKKIHSYPVQGKSSLSDKGSRPERSQKQESIKRLYKDYKPMAVIVRDTQAEQAKLTKLRSSGAFNQFERLVGTNILDKWINRLVQKAPNTDKDCS